jgi:hypothetical protein
MQIVFYDNEYDNIKDLEENVPRVEGIHIDDDIPNQFGDARTYPLYWADRGNTYATRTPESVNPTEGFNKEHAKQLLERVKRGEKLIAIFDWDRTLNVVEGVRLPPKGYTFAQYKINPLDAMEYQMGGKERFAWLKKMFKQLYENKIPVFVITSNKLCTTTKDNFLSHVQLLIPYMTDSMLVCSGRECGLSKSQALLANKTYKNIVSHNQSSWYKQFFDMFKYFEGIRSNKKLSNKKFSNKKFSNKKFSNKKRSHK